MEREEDHEIVRNTLDPLASKKLARKLKMKDNFENEKFDIMKEGLRIKFS